VITYKDIPGRQILTNCRPQMYLLSKDTVRFLGEAVAAVAAETEEIATQATRRIKVEYEALTPVFDPVEAMKDDAPKLHPPLPNWIDTGHVTRGDVARGFAEADVIVEGSYVTAPREHSAMEPAAALVYLDETGRFVFHSPHHHPFTARLWLADMLAVDPDRVRVIVPAMGGNFGMRGEFLHCGVAGLLALKTGRPVKIVYTREESMLGSGKSHSYHLKYKTGARKDGKLCAFQAELIADGGSWVKPPTSSITTSKMSYLGWSPGPYAMPNADVMMREVCTNRPRSSPLRGTNMPDIAFAFESQMDMLAEKLGIDPLELRILNAIQLNDEAVDGTVLDECVGAKATMEALRGPYAAALARAKSEPPAHPWRRGVGLGCVWKPFGGARLAGDSSTGGDFMGYPLGDCSAGIELMPDGNIRVRTGAVEKGQGIHVALAQIAAEELDLPATAVLPTFGGDTLLAPYPQATNGQRTTFTVGGAVIRAAERMRKALTEVAADMLNVPPASVRFGGGRATTAGGGELSLADLAAGLEARSLPLLYEATYNFEKSEKGEGPILSYASMLVELDVNVETGRLRVNHVTYVADPGKVINPLIFEGQVDGGVMMGLGYAMSEQFVPGETTNFKEYGLPMIKDSPEGIALIVVEDPVYGSPYGAKGAGETPSVPGMAAVANAIANATGTRPFEMPARSGRVMAALRSASERS
jgi:CO/xanthine dehydrogenase Mo-binding subunit